MCALPRGMSGAGTRKTRARTPVACALRQTKRAGAAGGGSGKRALAARAASCSHRAASPPAPRSGCCSRAARSAPPHASAPPLRGRGAAQATRGVSRDLLARGQRGRGAAARAPRASSMGPMFSRSPRVVKPAASSFCAHGACSAPCTCAYLVWRQPPRTARTLGATGSELTPRRKPPGAAMWRGAGAAQAQARAAHEEKAHARARARSRWQRVAVAWERRVRRAVDTGEERARSALLWRSDGRCDAAYAHRSTAR